MDGTDHDLLVSHGVQIKTVCKKLDDLAAKFDSYATASDTKCERRHDRFTDEVGEMYTTINECVKMSTFKWIIGIIVAALLMLFATSGTAIMSVNVLGKCVDLNSRLIEKHEIELKSHIGNLSK